MFSAGLQCCILLSHAFQYLTTFVLCYCILHLTIGTYIDVKPDRSDSNFHPSSSSPPQLPRHNLKQITCSSQEKSGKKGHVFFPEIILYSQPFI